MKDDNYSENIKQENQILDEIYSSAKDVEVPPMLQPENIDRLVSRKRKRPIFYKVGGAVAACLVLILTAAALAPKSGIYSKIETSGKAPEEHVFEAEYKEVETAEEILASAKNYDEIYDRIQTYQKEQQKREYAMMSGSNMAYGARTEAAEQESAAAEAAVDTAASLEHSETNVRTGGVDEGDLVKTDGKYIYRASWDGTVRIIRAGSLDPEIISEIKLENRSEELFEMYVDGDTMALVTQESTVVMKETEEDSVYMQNRYVTRIYTYDISGREKPVLKGTTTQDGYYQTSRKIGNYMYLFTEYNPDVNYNKLQRSDIENYIPNINGTRIAAEDIYIPDRVEGIGQLVISSINLEEPDRVQNQKSVLSSCQDYYVSASGIYLMMPEYRDGREYSRIIRFAYGDGKIEPKAAGEVEGRIKDSFCIDEYENHLRIVTTGYNGYVEKNALYILDENMKLTGLIDDIAPNENIRSARFMGKTGYFVTFKQIDPLFCVDLTDPAAPKLKGELKVTGFSEYLHFYGENKLLGIGWEVDPNTNMRAGLKLSMFDVSDPAAMKEIDKVVIKDVNNCPGLYNYRSILIDPAENIFGFAFENMDFQTNEVQSLYTIYRYEEGKGFENLLIQNLNMPASDGMWDMTQSVRGLYVGDIFYISSNQGVASYDRTAEYAAGKSLKW